MLIRELVARHLPDQGSVAVRADRNAVGDLARVTQARDSTDPDLVLIDVGDGTAAGDTLDEAPEAPLVLMLLTCPAESVPVGRVLEAARARDLHYLDAVPLTGSGGYRVGVVAGTAAGPPYGYLVGERPEGDPAARLAWEWGLGSLALRAADVRAQEEVTSLRTDLEAARQEVDTLRTQVTEQTSAAQRALGSPAYLLGTDLVMLRRRPVRGTGKLLADAVRLRRRAR